MSVKKKRKKKNPIEGKKELTADWRIWMKMAKQL